MGVTAAVSAVLLEPYDMLLAASARRTLCDAQGNRKKQQKKSYTEERHAHLVFV